MPTARGARGTFRSDRPSSRPVSPASPANSLLWPSCPRSWSRWRTVLRASDRKSTRLNSSHTVIYTLSLHDALPIRPSILPPGFPGLSREFSSVAELPQKLEQVEDSATSVRSEEHTSELQSHSDLHSFPTRRSSDQTVHPPARFPRPLPRILFCGRAAPEVGAGGGQCYER